MSARFSLLTKTYAGDFAAFASLCESIDRHMPHVHHHVVVDRADAALFAHFAGPMRSLMVAEDLLPAYRPITLRGRRLWLRAPFHLVRGWIFQQLAKLAAVASLPEDAVVLVDSDVIFLRPLVDHELFDGNKVQLYHRPDAPSGPAGQSDKWHDAARHALGLSGSGYTGADYISTVIAWSPGVVRAMLAQIEAANHRRWDRELLRNFRFSECVLYGVFAQRVDGPHAALLAPTTHALCHWCWPYDLSSAAGVAAFIEDLAPDKAAALVQSNLGLPDERRALIYHALREKAAHWP